MAADDDVTLGEVVRRFDRFERNIGDQLREIGTNAVSAAVWAIEKRTLEERAAGHGREIGQLRGEIKSMKDTKDLEHQQLEDSMNTLKDSLRLKDEQVRKERGQRYFALALAAAGALFGIIGTVVGGLVLAAVTGGP